VEIDRYEIKNSGENPKEKKRKEKQTNKSKRTFLLYSFLVSLVPPYEMTPVVSIVNTSTTSTIFGIAFRRDNAATVSKFSLFAFFGLFVCADGPSVLF
jgi:hypothetical protein